MIFRFNESRKSMKMAFLTSLLVSNFSFFCLGQNDENFIKICKEYPKGSNTISINTKDSIDIAFRKIAAIIMDYGFTIANSDKELYFINTDYMALNNYTFTTRVNVRLKSLVEGGTSIILKGDATNFGMNFPAANYHRKDVPNRAFAQMLEMAAFYKDGKIIVSTAN